MGTESWSGAPTCTCSSRRTSAPTAVPCAPWTSPRLRTSSGRRRDDCPQQQKRRKEGRKEEEGSKGGRKERIRRGAFPFRTCTLRLATPALCVVSRASRKKGRKEEDEDEEEEEEKRDRGVSLAVEGWW